MTKKLLIIIVITALSAVSQVSFAQDAQTSKAGDQLEIAATITVTESTIHVKNASQQTLEVYDLAGVKVATYKIDNDNKTIVANDLQKGCYILKINKTVRKVYIK